MKTLGLMAAISKIELDNFRERSGLGKRGKAKQGPQKWTATATTDACGTTYRPSRSKNVGLRVLYCELCFGGRSHSEAPIKSACLGTPT